MTNCPVREIEVKKVCDETLVTIRGMQKQEQRQRWLSWLGKNWGWVNVGAPRYPKSPERGHPPDQRVEACCTIGASVPYIVELGPPAPVGSIGLMVDYFSPDLLQKLFSAFPEELMLFPLYSCQKVNKQELSLLISLVTKVENVKRASNGSNRQANYNEKAVIRLRKIQKNLGWIPDNSERLAWGLSSSEEEKLTRENR